MSALSMAEMETAFCERFARSAISSVHVLLHGTHCIQQHFGDKLHIDIQFSIVGITSVIHLTSLSLGNTSDELSNFVKFRTAANFFHKEPARKITKQICTLKLIKQKKTKLQILRCRKFSDHCIVLFSIMP